MKKNILCVSRSDFIFIFLLIITRIRRMDLNIIIIEDVTSALDFIKMNKSVEIKKIVLEINKHSAGREKTLEEILKQAPGIEIIGLVVNPIHHKYTSPHYHKIVKTWKEALQHIP